MAVRRRTELGELGSGEAEWILKVQNKVVCL